MGMVDLNRQERSLLLVALEMVEERTSCTCPQCTGEIPGFDSLTSALPDVVREAAKQLQKQAKRRAADRRNTRIHALELKLKILEAEAADDSDDGNDGGEAPTDQPKPPAESKAPEAPSEGPAVDRNPTAEQLYGDERTVSREPELATADL